MIFFIFRENSISFKQGYERTICNDIPNFSIYWVNKKISFLYTTIDSSHYRIEVVY